MIKRKTQREIDAVMNDLREHKATDERAKAFNRVAKPLTVFVCLICLALIGGAIMQRQGHTPSQPETPVTKEVKS